METTSGDKGDTKSGALVLHLAAFARSRCAADRGAACAGGSKPATLETGAVINVPLFINVGEEIMVDTRCVRTQAARCCLLSALLTDSDSPIPHRNDAYLSRQGGASF